MTFAEAGVAPLFASIPAFAKDLQDGYDLVGGNVAQKQLIDGSGGASKGGSGSSQWKKRCTSY
jgi:hypothetical protein